MPFGTSPARPDALVPLPLLLRWVHFGGKSKVSVTLHGAAHALPATLQLLSLDFSRVLLWGWFNRRQSAGVRSRAGLTAPASRAQKPSGYSDGSRRKRGETTWMPTGAPSRPNAIDREFIFEGLIALTYYTNSMVRAYLISSKKICFAFIFFL